MSAIHQFVPSFTAHDAVSTHSRHVQRLIRSLGLASEIYVGTATGVRRGEVRSFRRYEHSPGDGPTWLFYQLSTGSPMAEFVASRPEPKVVNYHNLTPPAFFDAWQPEVAAELALGRRQLEALAPATDLAIAVSAYNERELVDAGFAATTVAPVLVDLDELDREVDSQALARLQQAKAGGGSDWLFVGRVAPNKAQHDLVKALAVYRRLYDPRARLHLVGGSSSAAYDTALASYVAALGLEGAVDLTGPVTPGVLAAHYRAADVFVCLSEHEGFCVPLLEAFHHRLPIVAYAAAAVPETMGRAGLLLSSKAPATVAAAVHRVDSDPALAATLAAAGAARLGDFRLDRARARFAEVVEGLR